MKIIIAARLSQKVAGQGQDGITSQDVDARDWAKEAGHEVVATLRDVASGTKPMQKRRELGPWVTDPHLMAMYQGIVAAKQDRLSRADWRDEADLRIWAETNNKTLFIVDRDLRWPPRGDSHHDDDVTNWNRGAEEAHREWNNTSRRYKRMHRLRQAENQLVGRPGYGYRAQGIECGEVPCRCFERKIDDHKTLVIFEPEAAVIREARDRYLGRGREPESLRQITDDFTSRGIPSPTYGKSGDEWHSFTLARLLRNPGIAGCRQNKAGKTVLRYEAIIPWTDHLDLIKRLDSRAHRKGISPANSYLLTGMITDEAGHRMYGIRCGETNKTVYYWCRRKGCLMARADEVDAEVSYSVEFRYGDEPELVPRIIPGKNHREDIARLRQERSELDDLAEGYVERHAAYTAEIRRLDKEDKTTPQADTLEWVDAGKTTAEAWRALETDGKRRDWLRQRNYRVVAYRQPQGWSLVIDTRVRQITAAGVPGTPSTS